MASKHENPEDSVTRDEPPCKQDPVDALERDARTEAYDALWWAGDGEDWAVAVLMALEAYRARRIALGRELRPTHSILQEVSARCRAVEMASRPVDIDSVIDAYLAARATPWTPEQPAFEPAGFGHVPNSSDAAVAEALNAMGPVAWHALEYLRLQVAHKDKVSAVAFVEWFRRHLVVENVYYGFSDIYPLTNWTYWVERVSFTQPAESAVRLGSRIALEQNTPPDYPVQAAEAGLLLAIVDRLLAWRDLAENPPVPSV